MARLPDPRDDSWVWSVESNGKDDAYVTIKLTNSATQEIMESVRIPRDVADMLMMGVLFDQFMVDGKTDAGGSEPTDDIPF